MLSTNIQRDTSSSSKGITKQRLDFGGANKDLLPNNFKSGLSSAQIIEADPRLARAKSKQEKIENKIEFTESKISALLQFRGIVQDIANTLEPLSALQVNGNITLFQDYDISLTTTDTKDADKYLAVTRTEDNGATLSVMGAEQKYKIYIKQLATVDSYDFNASFASATNALGYTGTLKINNSSFPILPNHNLNTLITNINDAKIGAFCTLIRNGSGSYNLSMKASSSGTTAAFDLTDNVKFSDETDDGNGNRLFGGLSSRLDIVTNHNVIAQNAIIKIDDSSEKTYQTNEITNALSGLEFSLISANSSTTTSVSIVLSKNINKVATGIIQYAACVNELNKFYKIHTYRKPSDGQHLDHACLYDETSFDSMYNSLRGMIDCPSDGLLASDLKFLIQLGLKSEEHAESKDAEGNLIPKYLEFALESENSVHQKIKEHFENVRKIFEINFSSDDSGLKLLTCGNKLSESKVFNFSLIINNNNLTGSDALTGLAYNNTKKAALTYTNANNAKVTIYPPIYEVNASGTGVIIKFPKKTDKPIDGYNPSQSPFEGMTFYYSSLPTTNTSISVEFSQGTGNKVLNYTKDMVKNAKLGGVIDSAINRLKEDLSAEKKKKDDNEEAVERLTQKASADFDRKTATMGKASYNSQLINAYNKERTKE